MKSSDDAPAQTRGGRIFSDTMLYGVATVVSQMASLILLPIYTRALTPRDYGILDLMQLIIDFTSLFVSMRLGEAIFRFYSGETDRQQANEMVSSCMVLALIMGAIGFGVVAANSKWLAKHFFEDESLTLLMLLMGGTLLLQPLVEVPAALVRAQQRPIIFVAFRIGGLVLRIALNLYLVVWHRMGVAGAVYANLLTTGTQALVMSIYAVHQVGFRFRWERARTVIGFSFPILVASLGSYYFGFADRYWLNWIGDLTAVGLYSMAARFGLAYFAFGFAPFEMAWDAERYNVARQPDAVPALQQTFRMLSAYLMLLGFAICLFSDEVLRFMAAEPFWAAAPLIPVFILNGLLMAWGSYARLGLLIQKQTRDIAKATWYAIPVTTVAFFFLIPRLGALGAVLSVAIGNAFRLIHVQHSAAKVFNMHLQWRRVVSMLAVLAIVAATARLLPVSIGVQICIDAGLLIGGALSMWFGPLLEPQDRLLILEKGMALLEKVRPARRSIAS